MESMKDLLGTKVRVGDTVAMSETGYNNLVKATVSKITPKGIKAKYFRAGSTYERETFRFPCQFVKVLSGE